MSTSRSNRVLWPDIVRCIAIYFVIVIHSTAPLTKSSQLWPVQLILNILSMTAVPLFVMLSGALLLPLQESTRMFFSKRLSRLLTPWVFWSLCTWALLLASQGNVSLGHLPRLLGSTMQSFWFLPMITGLYLITPALRTFAHAARRRDVVWLILLWFLGTSLLPYLHDSLAFPRSVDNGLVRQVVTYSGYYLLGWFVTQLRTGRRTMWLSLIFIFFGITWATLATLGMPLTATTTISPLQYGYIAPGVVLTSLGMFILLWNWGHTCDPTVSKRTRTYVQILSSATFGIYLSHLLIRDLSTSVGLSLSPIPSIWFGANYLNALLLFGVSCSVVALLQHIPTLRRSIA